MQHIHEFFKTSAEIRRPKSGVELRSRSMHGLGTFAVGLVILVLIMPAVMAQTDGSMVLKNLTSPRGGYWVPDALGGHWWQPDAVLGVCRVDPLPGANPPFQLTNCNGTAKSGGQLDWANGMNTSNGKSALYVPDSSTKSTSVVRFQCVPSNGTVSNPFTLNVSNLTSVGGGAGGGRPVAVAVAPNNPDNIFVAYLKSGDIMLVQGARTADSKTPYVVSKIGSTSDGRGVNAIAFFGNDLYIAETGGFGLSKIQDPAGVTRAPCTSAAPCTAVPLNPQISTAPGGLTTDGTFLYVGDAPFNGTAGRVLQYNPVNGAVTLFSQNIVPSYVASFNGTNYTQYNGPLGIGRAANGDIYVADDPTYSLVLAVLPTQQGHLWKVPFSPVPPQVTSIAPTSGSTLGGTVVTVTGTGFSIAAGGTQVLFGAAPGINVTCASVNSCTATAPASNAGMVDVRVIAGGLQSPIVTADQFTYIAPPPPGGGPSVTSIAPVTGTPGGGTMVTIKGFNLASPAGLSTVAFGVNAATLVSCSADGTSCTAASPAGVPGSVNVQVTTSVGTSNGVPFTYVTPVANLFAWGITAPKGGLLFIPGALGGHFWSSDHAQGLCRQDKVPGTTINAINFAVCDDGTIGSPGQAVYDPTANGAIVNTTSGLSHPAGTHYIYVPDNAVRSVAVWRLTFDPTTETIIDKPEGMVPLADVRTLKPNGMALGPDGNLYVTDLTEQYIRKIIAPSGDPRSQTLLVVAHTGDGRGANGSVGFIGNKLYISENRGATWIDITVCPGVAQGTQTTTNTCATTPIPLPSGVFVAGVATDPVNNMVYAADSPGAGNATIWRYNVASNVTSVYLTGGVLPATGSPNATVYCGLTCTRPWDPALTPGGIAPFNFAFGIWVDPSNGWLYITGDPTAGARASRGHAWVAPYIP